MLDPSVCTALPTLLGQRTRITRGLQRLMGCNLPMMQCSPQHCWELFHPFAQHCQHGRNNSQHCWANNVGSFCVSLHVSLWLKREIGREVLIFSTPAFKRLKRVGHVAEITVTDKIRESPINNWSTVQPLAQNAKKKNKLFGPVKWSLGFHLMLLYMMKRCQVQSKDHRSYRENTFSRDVHVVGV